VVRALRADPAYGPNAPRNAFGQPVDPVYGAQLPGTYLCCGGPSELRSAVWSNCANFIAINDGCVCRGYSRSTFNSIGVLVASGERAFDGS
jgi:hypothetical protein